MRRSTLSVLALTLAIPATLNAQWGRNNRGWQPSTNPFSVEVMGGAFKDALSLNDNTKGQIGFLGGLRVGYDLTRQIRLVGTGSYGQTNNVEGSSFNSGFSDFQYNNQWLVATGGLELVLVPGATSFAIGAQAGGAWEREVEAGSSCGGVFSGGCTPTEWARHTVYVPEATLRQQLTPRMALTVRGSDYIMPDAYGQTHQTPTLSVGMQFR